MSDEPESPILRHLREMRAEIGEIRDNSITKADLAEFATKADLAEFATKADLQSLRADVASDMLVMRKELGEQIVGLRRAVIDYHTSVIGHGALKRACGGSSSI